MKTTTLCAFGSVILMQVASASLVGSWAFDGDLTNRVLGGSALTTVSDSGSAIVESYDSAMIGGETATVANLARLGYNVTSGSGEQWLVMTNDASAPTSAWSLMMDINFDQGFAGNYTSLFQTDTGNAGDGDSFIHSANGIGVSGDYAGTVAASEWNRITITFDDSQLSYYINGSLVNQVTSTADRFNVGSSLLILVDNGAETSEALLNNLAFWDHTLSEVEVSGFGGASADAIVPEPSAYAMLIGLAALGFSMIRRRS